MATNVFAHIAHPQLYPLAPHRQELPYRILPPPDFLLRQTSPMAPAIPAPRLAPLTASPFPRMFLPTLQLEPCYDYKPVSSTSFASVPVPPSESLSPSDVMSAVSEDSSGGMRSFDKKLKGAMYGRITKREGRLTVGASTKEKPKRRFPCELCGKDFTRKSDARKHVRVVHERLKIFGCTECDKRFARKDYLAKHLKSVHGRQKNEIYSKLTSTPKNLLASSGRQRAAEHRKLAGMPNGTGAYRIQTSSSMLGPQHLRRELDAPITVVTGAKYRPRM